MSILGRLVAILLISFLAMAPGLAGAVTPSATSCDMVSMQHHTDSAGMTSKALSTICKIQCQAPAMLPQPEPTVQVTSMALRFPPMVAPDLPSRPYTPEAPPPRS